jgi:uncharacterized protein (TIGR00375 family)
MDLPHISQWAKNKGIDLIGTGDFTHPLWLSQITQELKEDGSGLLKSKRYPEINFIISGEISTIYTQGGKGRRVHTIIMVPDILTAKKIISRFTNIGHLYSDGRPILGISAKELAKIILDINPKCLIVPAHAWTPWFSVFGSNSGFDSLKSCYEELTPYIKSIETGLSSDPEMNWRLSALDKITLISNSDAHSPANLGREANVFELEPSNLTYNEIADILKTKDKSRFPYTIEFYPEEGKYHYDGHRNCNLVVNPFEKKYPNNICPVCGKRLTIGVMNRVEELADRPTGYRDEKFPDSKHLVPLREIIAASLSLGANSSKVEAEYADLVGRLGSEFKILLDIEEDKLTKEMNPKIAEGIIKVRSGKISIEPGYDGVYGKVKVFEEEQSAQGSLF